MINYDNPDSYVRFSKSTHSLMFSYKYLRLKSNFSLQCFDTVGWTTGRASSL